MLRAGAGGGGQGPQPAWRAAKNAFESVSLQKIRLLQVGWRLLRPWGAVAIRKTAVSGPLGPSFAAVNGPEGRWGPPERAAPTCKNRIFWSETGFGGPSLPAGGKRTSAQRADRAAPPRVSRHKRVVGVRPAAHRGLGRALKRHAAGGRALVRCPAVRFPPQACGGEPAHGTPEVRGAGAARAQQPVRPALQSAAMHTGTR